MALSPLCSGSCALSEAEVHWRDFFTSLKERGVGIPDFIVSDAHTGLRAALKAIFNANSRAHAEEGLRAFVERWQKEQPKLAAWAEENLPEGFAVFSLPLDHRRKMRTSNSCENLNNQIKRRTRVVGVFPSEDSLERLVTGVLIEISEGWETDRAYLKIEKTKPQKANKLTKKSTFRSSLDPFYRKKFARPSSIWILSWAEEYEI